MKSETKILSDGITLRRIPTEKFKTNRLSFHFIFPFAPKDAVYYSIFSALIRYGTESYPSIVDFARRLEYLYATSLEPQASMIAENEVISLSFETLRDRYTEKDTDLTAEAVRLCSDLLFHPAYEKDGTIRADFLKREKETLRRNILATFNSKPLYALHRCNALMCDGEKIGCDARGTLEQIDAFSEEEFFRFRAELLQNARVEIFATGDESEEALEKKLMPLVEKLGARKPQPFCIPTPKAPQDVRTFQEAGNTAQGNLCIGLRLLFSPESIESRAFSLASAIIGISPVSKLFMNVREKQSLCYTIGMSPDPMKEIAFIRAGISDKNYEKTLKAVYRELEAVQNGDFTDEELDYARAFMHDSYKSVPDSPSAMEAFSLRELMRGTEYSVEELDQILVTLTRDDVVNASRKIKVDTVYYLCGNGASEQEDSEND